MELLITFREKSKRQTNLIMFLQDLPESGEVESLVVLEQDEPEVELTEGQLEVVQCA